MFAQPLMGATFIDVAIIYKIMIYAIIVNILYIVLYVDMAIKWSWRELPLMDTIIAPLFLVVTTINANGWA